MNLECKVGVDQTPRDRDIKHQRILIRQWSPEWTPSLVPVIEISAEILVRVLTLARVRDIETTFAMKRPLGGGGYTYHIWWEKGHVLQL